MGLKIGAATVQLVPGLLDWLREANGCSSDAALADILGVNRMMLSRTRNGAEPAGVLIASIALATGLGMDKIVRVVSIGKRSKSKAA
ncbi:hypothetical protein [Nocardia gipuzkoensis]